LIGSELKSLTRVARGPRRLSAVDALVNLAADVKAIVGGDCVALRRGLDRIRRARGRCRTKCVSGSIHCGRQSSIDAIGIDYYAPLAGLARQCRRLRPRAQRQARTGKAIFAGNSDAAGVPTTGITRTAAAARAQTPHVRITDGRQALGVSGQKDIWNFWQHAIMSASAAAELSTTTGWVAQGKPIWLTELGCPAVDKGATSQALPDPEVVGARCRISPTARATIGYAAPFRRAVLAAFDPDFGRDELNPVVERLWPRA